MRSRSLGLKKGYIIALYLLYAISIYQTNRLCEFKNGLLVATDICFKCSAKKVDIPWCLGRDKSTI